MTGSSARSAEEALNEHFVTTGLLPAGSARSDWYAGHRIPIKLGRISLPFPILQREGPMILHDLHHLLVGCAPDWPGEVELAGWEIASGGCGLHFVYWSDRLLTALLGLVTAPRRLLRGFRLGRKCANLYGMRTHAALRLDTDELQKFIGLAAGSGA
jgi:hypothetical protein